MPPRISPAIHRACAPTPSKTAKGALPDPPHHKHSLLGAVPRRPTSLGHELLSPLAVPGPYLGRQSLGFPQVGASPAFGTWGFLGHPHSPAVD